MNISAISAITCPKISNDWRSVEASSIPIVTATDIYTLRLGWNKKGLVLFADVKDSNIIKNSELPWGQTSIEYFLAAAPGYGLTNPVGDYERLQLAIAVETQECMTVYDGTFGTYSHPHEVVVNKTPDGYQMGTLISWENLAPIVQTGLFRFQCSINLFNKEGHKTAYILNNAPAPSATARNYILFRLCDGPNPSESLALKWHPIIVSNDKNLSIDVNRPDFASRISLEITNREDEILYSDSNVNGHLELDDLSSIYLNVSLTAYDADGNKLGTVSDYTSFVPYTLKRIENLDWSSLTAWETSWWLSIVSAVEFIRMTSSESSYNNSLLGDAIMECEARLAIIDNKPLPADFPPRFQLLELARGLQAQLNISYSRCAWQGEVNTSILSVLWGNLPSISTTVRNFLNEKSASAFLGSDSPYGTFSPVDLKEFPGADEGAITVCWALCGELKGDYLPHRYYHLYSRRSATTFLRLTDNELSDADFQAICILPDADSALAKNLRAIAKEKGLPEIDFSERDNFEKIMIVGTPGKPLVRAQHPSSGIIVSSLYLRKGTLVYIIPCHNMLLAKKMWAFIHDGKPITQELAREFAAMKAEEFPEASPEEQALAPFLRVGDNHTHTTTSDGASTPLCLFANAPIAGFDFLSITDHNGVAGGLKLEEELKSHGCSFPQFTGVEVTMHPKYHINIYPVTRNIEDDYSMAAIRKFAAEENAVLQLNHPMTYGTNFEKLWYDGDFTLAGFDTVERFVTYRHKWEAPGHAGKVPASVGNTDTHRGMFGYLDSTILISPEETLTKAEMRDAIKAGDCAMLDSFTPAFIYGNETIRRAAGYAFRCEETPKAFARRLKQQFSHFNPLPIILNSDIRCLYTGTKRPKEAYLFDEEEKLIK